jgi:hypothetical protein
MFVGTFPGMPIQNVVEKANLFWICVYQEVLELSRAL